MLRQEEDGARVATGDVLAYIQVLFSLHFIYAVNLYICSSILIIFIDCNNLYIGCIFVHSLMRHFLACFALKRSSVFMFLVCIANISVDEDSYLL